MHAEKVTAWYLLWFGAHYDYMVNDFFGLQVKIKIVNGMVCDFNKTQLNAMQHNRLKSFQNM